jgi:hypothetical protein
LKAEPFQIGDVLKDRKRFIVPIYQRTYAWTKGRQLEKFFDAIEDNACERIVGKAPSFPHYMGAILLCPRGKYTFGAIPVFDIVDGQQRLMTYQIFLAALRDIAKSMGGTSLAEQLTTFLLNPDTHLMKDSKNECYKLEAAAFDRTLFRDLINLDQGNIQNKYPNAFFKNGKIKESDTPLPLRAWWYFRDEAQIFIHEENEVDPITRLEALSAALLEDFRVIVITLDDTDDAQVIFETLNTGGEPLAAMDLVRNDVFHRAIRRDEDVDALMEERWSIFENSFWKEEVTQGRIKKPRIDFFLAHTLAAETGKEVLFGELYARYKAFVANQGFPTASDELDSLLKHVGTYLTLLVPEGAEPLADLARQLNVFDVSTAYPLVFVIAASKTDDEEKTVLYRLISSYIVRRAICGLTPKAYNNTFIRVAGHLRENSVSRRLFASMFDEIEGDSVRFPTDQELRTAIRTRALYEAIPTSRLRYILGKLEKASRDKFDETTGLRNDLTIEHVLPVKWAEYWPLLDGAKAPLDYIVTAEDPRHTAIAYREALKHTLGNLTLLTPSGNPRLGNLPFMAVDDVAGLSKRDALRASLLKMNQEIAAHSTWGETQISERADVLASRAISIWPHPSSISVLTEA